MTTSALIAVAVVAVIVVVALVVALPWLKERSRLRKSEHELGQRRDRVSAEHREQASLREGKADEAEHRARLAEKEAQRERAEAELHAERAELHEQGLADDELVEDHERERFAGTSAVADDPAEPADRDARALGDDPESQRGERRFMRGGRENGSERTDDREADTLHRRR